MPEPHVLQVVVVIGLGRPASRLRIASPIVLRRVLTRLDAEEVRLSAPSPEPDRGPRPQGSSPPWR
jgi:hypothetical protein